MKRKWAIVALLAGLEIFVFAGIVLAATSVRWRWSYVADTQATETVEKSLDVGIPATLEVDNEAGDVVITAGDVSQIILTATRHAWGRGEADARANLQKLALEVVQAGEGVKVTAGRPERKTVYLSRYEGGTNRVDLTITVPRRTAVGVKTRFGAVSLEGTVGDARLETSFGDVEVRNVVGAVVVESDNGDIEVAQIEVPAELQTRFGQVILRDVKAPWLTVKSSSGGIRLERIGVEGPLELHSDFGTVAVREARAGSITVDTEGGSVRLDDITLAGRLEVDTSFGRVEIETLQATSVRVNSSIGALELYDVEGALDLRTSFGGVQVRRAKATSLTITADSGSVTFEGELARGNDNRIETRSGSVRLDLPEDIALRLDVSTTSGRIRSDFPVAVEGEQDEHHLRGVINAPEATLTVKTDTGNIRLVSQ